MSPGETEAGSAGKQPRRGIARWKLIEADERRAASTAVLLHFLIGFDRFPHALKIHAPRANYSLTQTGITPIPAEPGQTDHAAIVLLRHLVPLGWDRTLGCFTSEVEIVGNEVGARGKISAHWDKFDAEAKVIVVQHELTGPFSFEPKIVDEDFGPQRAVWDRPNRLLKISAKHKSVGRYLGPAEEDFPGQEKPHFKTLLAEIVADQVVRYIIETREEKQGRDEDLDAPAFYLMHQKYVGEFLPIAHETQLPLPELRKIQ
jgi:hypothetical protein